MTEGKRNIIRQLLEEYDIQTIKEMMEAEMDDHLGYEKSERSDNDDYRNGYKRKRVNSSYGSMEIEVPQDRKSTMYAKGMTTRQISETIEDIYGFETSEDFISDVTDKILPQIEDWQNRPLDEIYPDPLCRWSDWNQGSHCSCLSENRVSALYLATFEATKKWTTTIQNRDQVYGELSIMYEGRLPD